MYLPFMPRSFSEDGIDSRQFHQLVIENRRPHLQRMGHAGSVNLHQDVVGEICLYVNILNPRERIFGICSVGSSREAHPKSRNR